MIGRNKKKKLKNTPSFFQRMHKFVSSVITFALLLPSISSIALVQAAEKEAENLPVETVVPQSEPETDKINSEVEDLNMDTETPLPSIVPEEDKSKTRLARAY